MSHFKLHIFQTISIPTFVRVRSFILIFLFLPLLSLAQDDSLVLSFKKDEKVLSAEHKQQFEKTIDNRRIEKIIVKAYIANNEAVAKNRINVLYRLNSFKNFCQSLSIYYNIISEEQITTKDPKLFNKFVVFFDFIQKKKGKVVFRTSTVEITEHPPNKRSTPQIVKKDTVVKPKPKAVKKKPIERTPIKRKTYGVLNIDDFRKDQRITIPELYFEATRHTLRRTSYQSLRDLLAILKDRPTMKIRLEGHICCKKNGKDGMDFGTQTPNLSENRAKAICEYLIQNGIDPYRLSYIGFGSKYKLVEDHGSAIKGLKNRRVEVFVVSE